MKKLFVLSNWIGVLKSRALIQLYKKDLFIDLIKRIAGMLVLLKPIIHVNVF